MGAAELKQLGNSLPHEVIFALRFCTTFTLIWFGKSDLKERVRIVNSTENGILISIHQNNFPDSRYSGAQIFYGKQDHSKDFALMLQESFTQTLNKGSNRKIKSADGVYLMQHVECPAVLVECGFLSNIQEEALLRSPDYQKKLCCVIVTATLDFLDRNALG